MSDDVCLRHPVLIHPIAESEGGGFLASFRDFPGCVSDGATPDEAFWNALDALDEWLETNGRRRGSLAA